MQSFGELSVDWKAVGSTPVGAHRGGSQRMFLTSSCWCLSLSLYKQWKNVLGWGFKKKKVFTAAKDNLGNFIRTLSSFCPLTQNSYFQMVLQIVHRCEIMHVKSYSLECFFFHFVNLTIKGQSEKQRASGIQENNCSRITASDRSPAGPMRRWRDRKGGERFHDCEEGTSVVLISWGRNFYRCE